MRDFTSVAGDIDRTLPTDLGTVMSFAFPATAARGLVICIGDLHSHVRVQRNTAAIIEHLVRNHQFQIVCVEGACGPGDVTEIWSIPLKRRLQFCDYLFEKGYLTGAEFATVSRPELGIELWGVDVAPLYRTQWTAFRNNLGVRSDIVLVLSDFRRRLRRLYAPLITRDLLRLLRLGRSLTRDDGEEQRYLNDEDVRMLLRYEERKGLTLSAHLKASYARWSELETHSSAKSTAAVKGVHNFVDKSFAPFERTLDKLRADLREELNPTRLLDVMRSAVSKVAHTDPSLKELNNELQTQLQAEFSIEQLTSFNEKLEWVYDRDVRFGLAMSNEQKHQLWSAVAAAACTAEIDRIVLRLERQLDQVLRFLRLRMNADESLMFLNREQDQHSQGMKADLERLNYMLAAKGDECVPLDPVIALLTFWDYSEQYYTVARQRSTGIAINTNDVLTKRGLDRAIVISGGFHSRDISDWLMKSAKFATAIIVPKTGDSLLAAAEDRYNQRGSTEE